MTLEAADADISCLMEERGPQLLLDRYGIDIDDIEYLAFMQGDNAALMSLVLHGVLLGLAYAELREREPV